MFNPKHRSGMQGFLLLLLLFTKPNTSTPTHLLEDLKVEEGIHFSENKWAEVIKKSASENKYIFVDLYASWCPSCKRLQRRTFKNNDVAAFYNKNFINVSLDVEKGEGPSMAASLNVRATPTLLIFSPDGTPVLKSVGYLEPGDLINFGKTAIHSSSVHVP
jgi:thiol:disulfide interchange protein